MPKTPNYFRGRTLVITGAGSGIGRATAAIFGREGANVVCADIDEQSAVAAARETEGAGGVAAELRRLRERLEYRFEPGDSGVATWSSGV